VTNEDWVAERKRRMAEVTAGLEAEAEPPRQRGKRVGGHWYTDLLALAILLAVSWLLISSALTLARFTGNSLDDAGRRGTATVEQCDRRGPITVLHGFGFYRECTVSIAWNTGSHSRVAIDKPGFFRDDKAGGTVEIGQNTGSRGRLGYSRAALPDRPWITVVAGVLDVVGALVLLAVVFYLWRSVQGVLRGRAAP
jgi:hypothetical protein